MSTSVIVSDNPNKRQRSDESEDEISATEIVDQPSKKKISKFGNFFKLETIKGEKKAICLVCEKSKVKKIISRKDNNTTGMKRHLMTAHSKSYEEIFGSSTSIQKSVSSDQKKLTDMFSEQVISFYINLKQL